MLKLGLLERKHVEEKSRLGIFKKRGILAAVTDYALMTGTKTRSDSYIGKDKNPEQRRGGYWIKDDLKTSYETSERGRSYIEMLASAIGSFRFDNYARMTECGIRPIIEFDSLNDIPKNKGSKVIRAEDGVLEIELGYLPRKVAKKYLQNALSNANTFGKLKKVGKTYTRNAWADMWGYKLVAEDVYEYNGRQYVYTELNDPDWEFNVPLSTGERFRIREKAWVEVEPMKWWVDEEAKLIVTDKIVVGGIQYDEHPSRDEFSYESATISKYLDILSREMFQCELEKISPEELENKSKQVERKTERRVTRVTPRRLRRHSKEEAECYASKGVPAYKKIVEGYMRFRKRDKDSVQEKN